MIRSLRRAHRWIWALLAALPILVLLALGSRSEPLEPVRNAPWEAGGAE